MFSEYLCSRGGRSNGEDDLKERAVFLDRDGTIIVEKNYLHDPSEVELIPGTVEGLRILHRLGFKLVIITNQSGLRRGYLTENQLESIHERLIGELKEQSIPIAGIYFSPDLPNEGSLTRKPNTALIDRATRDLSLQLKGSYCIGDKREDIEMGKGKELKTILVLTGYGIKTKGTVEPDHTADNLLEAAQWIEREERR
jgi:D-glycero-D-manno-heptose 1,7-bisphosphate phosphatase